MQAAERKVQEALKVGRKKKGREKKFRREDLKTMRQSGKGRRRGGL